MRSGRSGSGRADPPGAQCAERRHQRPRHADLLCEPVAVRGQLELAIRVEPSWPHVRIIYERGIVLMIDSAWKDWYRSAHNGRCRASGELFEKYVTEVLKRFHTDFLNPSPMGTHGDGGCDGVAEHGSILYACYGQRATTDIDRKTRDKLESDFARAIANWSGFSTWRFVTNASCGPMTTKSVVALQQQHAQGTQRPISIEIWDVDELWWKAVDKLKPSQIDQVIPGVPHAQDVELEDLVQLIQRLETMDRVVPDRVESIRPVPLTKMDFNNLPKTTRAEFNEGRMLSTRIDDWFSEQADPELRDEKARRFRAIYQEARHATRDVREIVRRIYGALGGQDFDLSTKRANAVYAVTAYFFDSCDIFEEPPVEYVGGEGRDVASH